MKYVFIFLMLIFTSCEKTIGDYRYYYKVIVGSPQITVTYKKKSTNKNETITIINSNYQLYNSTWEYAWYSTTPNEKYFVSVKNDSSIGFVKLIVGRNLDTLKVESTTTQLSFKRN